MVTMGSYVFSDEEAEYLKAVLKWQDTSIPAEEWKRRLSRLMPTNAEMVDEEKRRRKPVGEFRILVIGAKDTGKTAILTRVCSPTFAE